MMTVHNPHFPGHVPVGKDNQSRLYPQFTVRQEGIEEDRPPFPKREGRANPPACTPRFGEGLGGGVE
jgi:hypothetical protein